MLWRRRSWRRTLLSRGSWLLGQLQQLAPLTVQPGVPRHLGQLPQHLPMRLQLLRQLQQLAPLPVQPGVPRQLGQLRGSG